LRWILFHIILISCICTSSAQELSLKDCFLSEKLRETRFIAEDQLGFIWMMRSDGFYRFDGKDFDFIDISYDLDQPFYHSSANILALENGDYWFAAKDAGLYVYKAQEDRFFRKNIFEVSGKPVSTYIRDIISHPHEDQQKIVAGNKGIWIINDQLEVLNYFAPREIYTKGIYRNLKHRANEIRKLVYDKKRDLVWMGGMLGLFAYDVKQDSLTRYPVEFIKDKLENGRDSYLVNDIRIDGDQLICATWFGGLMKFDIPSKKWASFSFEKDADALLKYGNTQIAKTENGQLFTAHEREVLGSWQQGDQYMNIPTANGKPINRGIGTFVDRLGYLWVGHWSNICRYQIKIEPPKAKTAQVYIRKLLLDSSIIKQRMNRWDHQSFQFSKEDALLQLHFRAINPLRYQDIKYEYRLEGLQSDWIKNDTSEVTTFRDLKKGTYQFQARYFDAISNEYIYSGKLALIYKPNELLSKYLFYGILTLLILWLLSFFLYRHFSKKRRLQAIQKYETQLREVQDAALRSQMNPHFLFNSLNSIRYFIVANDNDKAAGYLTKFSRLIRMILENSKKKTVLLADEIHLLDLYVNMEQIRFEDKFDYEVVLAPDLDIHKKMIPPMLIQPYIENAIIHGINPKEGRGKITLEISQKDQYLLLQIIDNGIGREKSRALKKQSLLKKESLGMSITKTRLDLASSKEKAKVEIIDLKNDLKEAMGTEIQIWLPYS